jgi:hypothetical protein
MTAPNDSESSTDKPAGIACVMRLVRRWGEDSRVIGIIDWSGSVHSRVAQIGEDHDKHFGWRMNKCWDWDIQKQRLYHEGSVDEEDVGRIMRHLRRKGFISPNARDLAPPP